GRGARGAQRCWARGCSAAAPARAVLQGARAAAPCPGPASGPRCCTRSIGASREAAQAVGSENRAGCGARVPAGLGMLLSPGLSVRPGSSSAAPSYSPEPARGAEISHMKNAPELEALVQAALSLLNTSANGALLERGRRGPCVRCAVVGNGGILNGSGAGRAIDAHDYVFRVNGAITEGFERDVGNRTSFYVFSTNTLMNSLSSYAADGFRHPPQTPETRYVFLPDHDRDYLLLRAAVSGQRVQRGRDRGAWPQELFGEQLRAAKFKMLHPDFVRYVRNRFLWADILATPRHALYRPSTGAVMLLAALHTCDEVSAFGFLTPDYQAYSDHYFDRRHKQVQFFANHDLRKEMQLWQQLQRCGLLHLYTGRTGT
uniref:alpha-N-acetylgalactosaminide alpha-2,6-sialyltransferase n=1 Tax=Nothoprocta perdicaria TaxID=30464 RepID=A0A8C6ZD63_NOTPE